MTEAAPAAAEHPIGVRLRESGINTIAIIDDAYDAPVLGVDFDPDDVAAFLKTLRDEEHVKAQLEEAFGPITDEASITSEVTSKLWDWCKAGELGALKDVVERLLQKKLEQLRDVERVRAHLKTLGFEPLALGKNGDPPNDARLVFLDYVLDPTATMDLAALSTQKATALYERAGDQDKPFIVLMSDRPGAAEQRDNFRQRSRLLGGMFGFISKEDASSAETLFLRLASWGIGNQTHHDLQRFVETVLSALGDVTNTFRERVLALGVQDYAFIQQLSLHEEGHPLGDYVLWLFESSLGHTLREHAGVRSQQSNLDTMRFEKCLPCHNPPSQRIAEFYLSAITEPAVGDLSAHPHDEGGTVPLLGLGDIFVNDDTDRVLMVATAACDLAFSPLGGRKCDPEQPVYLAPGKLQALSDRDGAGSDVRTELLSHKTKPHRILWDYKHTESKRLKEVWKYLEEEKYQRRWRLRLPYALVVQQAFANQITRVGLPVAPPVFTHADLNLYYKGEGNNATVLGDTIQDGLLVIHGDDADHFVLTVDCVNAIVKRIEGMASAIEATADGLDKNHEFYQQRLTGITARAEKVRVYSRSPERWVPLLETPRPLPKQGEKIDLDPALLRVCNRMNLEGKYQGGAPFTLNIVPPPPPPPVAGAQAGVGEADAPHAGSATPEAAESLGQPKGSEGDGS